MRNRTNAVCTHFKNITHFLEEFFVSFWYKLWESPVSFDLCRQLLKHPSCRKIIFVHPPHDFEKEMHNFFLFLTSVCRYIESLFSVLLAIFTPLANSYCSLKYAPLISPVKAFYITFL